MPSWIKRFDLADSGKAIAKSEVESFVKVIA
jgi:hypothetical protein